MDPERRDFLNLRCPPGRITAAEAAYILGCEPDHIFILLGAKMLKPLGKPPPGTMKFFLRVDIERRKDDAKWMDKASETIRRAIRDKNERAAHNRKLNGHARPARKQSVGNGQA